MSYPKQLMEMGYAFVCACCSKLHRGIGVGASGCVHVSGDRDCGGPLVGKAFPEYEGPLTRQSIAQLCFRCGKRADVLIQTNSDFFVGVCKEHAEMVRPNSSKAMVPIVISEKKTA